MSRTKEHFPFSQEPLGGAHADPSWTSQQTKLAVVSAMNVCISLQIIQ